MYYVGYKGGGWCCHCCWRWWNSSWGEHCFGIYCWKWWYYLVDYCYI